MAGVEGMENTQQKEDTVSPKKPRKRLKKLCAEIRTQMEFYFSNANIHKSRFMKDTIAERKDRYVPLSIFANFNKLRALSPDMKLVAKALSSSKVLEMSEDAQMVRRRTPFQTPVDTDERTLYVECLPKDVDQDWLMQTFSEYGKVVYVGLPRYKTTGDIKGFAFIEFDSAEAVDKSCHSLPSVDPESEKTPRFPKYNKQLSTLHRQMHLTGAPLPAPEKGAAPEKGEERRIRRRRNTSESSGGDAPAPKRQKQPQEAEVKSRETSEGEEEKVKEQEESEKESDGSQEKSSKKRTTSQEEEKDSSKNISKQETGRKRKHSDKESEEVKASTESSAKVKKTNTEREKVEDKKEEKVEDKKEEEEKQNVKGVMVKRKRLSDVAAEGEGREVKRVRINEQVEVKENVVDTHKKRRKKSKKKKEQKEKTEDVYPHIKVIPKCTWLQLRKEYLQLQKSSMKSLKKSLHDVQRDVQTHEESGEVNRSGEVVPMERYVSVEEKEKESGNKYVFTPGVIVKVESITPFNKKELKDTLSLVAKVPYIDLQDGDTQGHVRCATAGDALRIIASNPCSYNVNLLQGEEEQVYWKKIEEDRQKKRTVKTRGQKRGTQKLIARAEKTVATPAHRQHIVFDD